ncbi:hypothetical protein VNO78_16331 [Psophocarpus tetragonolobus]|uniref:Uncharacterized protein n=1 Tax=Psophocarpus tetragonolobus TaxID=3891 RepID=A0AAN9SM43_PSOTE
MLYVAAHMLNRFVISQIALPTPRAAQLIKVAFLPATSSPPLSAGNSLKLDLASWPSALLIFVVTVAGASF